jgi:tetratricopeptide (TPR) repeat protein
MSAVWSLIALVVAAVVLEQPRATARQLLEQYRSRADLGAELERQFSTRDAAVRFLNEIRSERSRHSALTYAAFALEAGGTAAERYPGIAVQLVELGCAALRREEKIPETFARLWHIGLISTLSGPLSDRTLGLFQVHEIIRTEYWADHFAHLPGWLRDDPEVSFAWGVSRQAAIHTFDITWGRSDKRSYLPPRILKDGFEAFQRALADERLHHESLLRIGWLHNRLGETAEANRRWDALDRPSTPAGARYLALLFTARHLVDTNQRDEALVLYRRALALQPDTGHAAWLALSALESAQSAPSAGGLRSIPQQGHLDPWLYFFESYSGLGRDRNSAVLSMRQVLK